MNGPLEGIKVVDFSTLLPGPLATLMLAEAGADVLKIERPGGEDMRHFPPVHGQSSAPFMALNGGKVSEVLDLKLASDVARAFFLVREADILVEQFRPGVMDRLGLGYAALSAANPRLIYCSITGFGQSGPSSQIAGHDLNYQALSGVLAQGLKRGEPAPLPPVLVADIAGGAYPAVINILLALRQREQSGQGCHLDIGMTDGSATFAWFAEAEAAVTGRGLAGGTSLLNGGSPRYQIYPTHDGWFLAVGALEDKFWTVFCEAIELPAGLRGTRAAAPDVIAAVASIISDHDACHWRAMLEPLDCCCTVVRTLDEARADRVGPTPLASDIDGSIMPLTRVPISPLFRRDADEPRAVPPLRSARD
ncbi:MAG: CaiB/BaiF CoA transferase family protein [Bosea sp. (in: a-proteobacteria)]